jgi:hypothetical protein
MKKVGIIAAMLLAALAIPTAASAGTEVDVEPAWTTYCGWPDVTTHPRELYAPYRHTDPLPDRIFSVGNITCTPAPLTWGIFVQQLQQKDRYGIYQDYGAEAILRCGLAGQIKCPAKVTMIDWVYCNTSGWYRSYGSIYGKGGNPPSTNFVERYSVGAYITCP